ASAQLFDHFVEVEASDSDAADRDQPIAGLDVGVGSRRIRKRTRDDDLPRVASYLDADAAKRRRHGVEVEVARRGTFWIDGLRHAIDRVAQKMSPINLRLLFCNAIVEADE